MLRLAYTSFALASCTVWVHSSTMYITRGQCSYPSSLGRDTNPSNLVVDLSPILSQHLLDWAKRVIPESCSNETYIPTNSFILTSYF